MLNEEKVRIMSRLATYEKKEGKKCLQISKYYRSDYIGLALIKNFFLVTIAYVLILAVGVLYYAEELLDNINNMNLWGIGIGLILIYLIILILYSLVVYILCSVRYSRAKKSVKRYYTQLGKIAQMYAGMDGNNNSQNRSRRKQR